MDKHIHMTSGRFKEVPYLMERCTGHKVMFMTSGRFREVPYLKERYTGWKDIQFKVSLLRYHHETTPSSLTMLYTLPCVDLVPACFTLKSQTSQNNLA